MANPNVQIKKQLLFDMLRLRLVEEEIALKYGEQQMRCPVHLSIGQEAVSAAVGLCLNQSDFAVSGHRAHTHFLAKGGSLKKLVAELYGRETGCSRGRGGSMHLVDLEAGFQGSTAIVGGTIPIGVGLAYSAWLKETKQISCVFLGDGAVEEGVFYESLNFAALKGLPVLFICENNFYSVYSSLSVRQPTGRRIYEMVEAIGVRSSQLDGNDALSIFQAVGNSVKEMRSGGGPRFFEFSTYRWREHCGPNFDNDIGYRAESEFLEWKKKDPIAKLESSLLENGHVDLIEIDDWKAKIRLEINLAFEEAMNASPAFWGNEAVEIYAR